MLRERRARHLFESADACHRRGETPRAVRLYQRVLGCTYAGEVEHELSHARLADLSLGLGRPRLAGDHLSHAIACRRATRDRDETVARVEAEYAVMRARIALGQGEPVAALEPLIDAVACPVFGADALGELAQLTLAQDGARPAAAHLARLASSRAPTRHGPLARTLADA